MTKSFILLFSIHYSLITVFFTGCSKPTYPKNKLEISAKKILKKEYNLDCSLKLVGKTLYMEVKLSDMLSTEKNLPEKVIKKYAY